MAVAKNTAQSRMPWKIQGWTERAAAAHLLDRFAFGARPGEVDSVVERGLERWFDEQVDGGAIDRRLEDRIADLDLVDVSVRDFPERVPRPGALVVELREAGILPQDADPQNLSQAERRRLRPQAMRFLRQRGYSTQRQYVAQLVTHKLLRAVYSPNQLHEVLTDFWFNHFNVSLTDNQCRNYVLAYERDAIRPHLLGDFRALLGATAKHPAMLRYLDNAQSTAELERRTTLDFDRSRNERGRSGRFGSRSLADRARRRRMSSDRPNGLNENYARELMELHTLGVDGGYDQTDVIEVARAFTGWSSYPSREFLERIGPRFQQALTSGIIQVEDGFLFRSDAHDAERKRVLGTTLAAGRGLEDGEEVLDLLASQPATARFIGRKLAVRFVTDEPGQELVERLAERFAVSGGDLATVVTELAYSPEFWGPENRRDKIKSPLELAVSALRALAADVRDFEDLFDWLERMGQPLYSYEAPTGFPDRAAFWVNAGSLLNRMNFGLTLAANQVAGIDVDLIALNDGHEPESRREALAVYGALLLPEREFDASPLLALTDEPELAERVQQEATTTAPAKRQPDAEELLLERLTTSSTRSSRDAQTAEGRLAAQALEPQALEQVVGVLLGSPEFQRR